MPQMLGSKEVMPVDKSRQIKATKCPRSRCDKTILRRNAIVGKVKIKS